MAEVEEVPANVAEEGEEQKTLQEDAEGKREGSPSSASSSDPEGVDAGEEKEQGGETQATGEEQTEPQEPVEEEQAAGEPEKPAEPEEQEPTSAEPEQAAAKPDKPVESEQEAEKPDKPVEQEPSSTEQEQEAAGPEKQPEPATAEPETEHTVVTLTFGEEDAGPKEKPVEEERERSPTPGVSIQYGEFLRLMQVGTDLTKIKKKGYPRVYRLDDDLLGITWNSRSKRSTKARIAIKQVKEVRSGRSTDSFKLARGEYPDERCFSVIYVEGNKFKTLDLVAMSDIDANAWVLGLKMLVKEESSGQQRSKVRERWLRDLFEEADKNGDGTLDMKEVLRIMQRLNIGISKKVLKQKFKEADSDGNYDNKLDFEEFCSLFKDLATRPELRRLFNLYSSKKEWLTVEDLQRFLEVEQGVEDPSPEYCTQIINKYEQTDEGKAQSMMSSDGFTQFMLGSEMDIFNQSHGSVYQDMTQPLSHYYIASSHNTYLLEDQLKGPSSVEAYIRALRKGCRCVELDCWDGDGGEPVIYHGHTLTSKILFKDAIASIKEHAFAVSPYPVILSIENHCSIPQQHVMAQHMVDIFGDLLCDEDVDENRTALPSPEELKHKILIKGKKLKKELEDLDNDDGEVSDEDEAADIDPQEYRKAGVDQPETPPTPGPAKADEPPETPKEGKTQDATEGATAAAKTEEPKTEEEQKPDEEKKEEGATGGAEAKPEEPAATEEGGEKKPAEEGEKKPAEEGEKKPDLLEPGKPSRRRTLSFNRKQKRPQPATPGKKIKLSAKLSKCVNYVQSIHFKGFQSIDDGKINQMSSFGEGSAMKYSTQSASRFVLYNKRQLSRIYPAGSRVNSSNYDPVNMWNCGCQIVALNYQTTGKSMDFNEGKFLQNGRSGYILKPEIMREELSRFDHTNKRTIPGVSPKLFTLKVISGHHLPKPEGGSKTGEIIDPYVVIQLVGVPEDKRQVKTKPVNDNGFNPEWNETFQFVIRFPELALVRFKVMDRDWGPNKDDFIGQFTLPFESIEPGFRHVHLTSYGNLIENATLFVHVDIRDYVAAGPTKGHAQKGVMKFKRAREYPEPQLVDLYGIDEHFRASRAHLRRAVDLREDYMYGLAHFKESVGRGPQALLGDCVEVVAARAKGSGLALCLNVVGETEGKQVYRVGVSTEMTSVPGTLQNMMNAFNHLNEAIRVLLVGSEDVAEKLAEIYAECKKHLGDLKDHYLRIAAPEKKADQAMEHYCWTMRTLQSEASNLQKLREDAANNLKKLLAASQKYEIELKTAL